MSYRVEHPDRRLRRGRRPPAQAETAATGPQPPTTPQDASFCGSPTSPDPPPTRAVTAATGPQPPTTLRTQNRVGRVARQPSSASTPLRSPGKAGLLYSHAIAVCGGAHRANDFCAPACPQGRRAHTKPSPHPRAPAPARELSLSGRGESLGRGRRAPICYPGLRPRMSRPDEGLGRGRRAFSRLRERARELSFTLTEMPFSGLPFSGFWGRR